MQESTHDKLTRNRKPHVHITYKVFTDGAEETRELPFVVGVLGSFSGDTTTKADFSGDPTKALKPFRDREFIQIDRENFDTVMQRMRVGLNLQNVDNTLSNDGTVFESMKLKFESIEDFTPAKVANQVPVLRKLLETREQLKSLLDKADRSGQLEGLLEKILANADEIKKASEQLGGKK